jgi:molybdate transport system substrate-binding protein
MSILRFLALIAVLPSLAMAGEVRVVSTVAARTTLEALKPVFERSTPHKVEFLFGTAAPLKRQIEAGESFDVTVLTPGMVDDLAKTGKVDGASKTDFGRTGLAIATRKDAKAPDISTGESLKRALASAKAITYTKEGQSGVEARKLIERLGLTEEMKDRTLVDTRSGGAMLNLEEGKADLGFTFLSEILDRPGVQLVGSVPAELRGYMTLSAGISSGARDAAASRAFVQFLRSDEARAVMKQKGLEGL